MEIEIAGDVSSDCVIFRILPENRYEACIYSSEQEEMAGHGPLDQLLEHLPGVKDQIANGVLDNFKLELPNTNDHRWFPQATLTRFLHIIGSSDLHKAIAIGNEMSQLEEARKFHLSLYTKAEGITTSDTSKNELLRAMDSRLAALAVELASAVNLCAGATLSFQDVGYLQNCCQHFGDVKTRNLISKLSEASQKSQINSSLDKSKPSIPFVSKEDYASKSAGNHQVSHPVIPVKYSASPAKAAKLERQDSFSSDDASSFSSEDDQPPVERSRTMARSASPRRSASPMRKVQIGRSGSRRAPALAIRSLPYFPPRISSNKDISDSEVVEESNKKTEVNVTRISVQDAISLFERKQKDDTIEKKTVSDTSVNLNKAAVLRRWSSGMGESRKSSIQDTAENTDSDNRIESFEEDPPRQVEVDNTVENDIESQGKVEVEVDVNLNDGQGSEIDENGEKLDSVEWTRQKEAELNQMLMKFAQYNLSNTKTTESDTTKSNIPRLAQKDGTKVHQKEGTNEKPKGEKTGKKVEKQADSRVIKKKVLDKPKAEKPSAKATDVVRKSIAKRTPNVIKHTPMSSNPKKESPKPEPVKRVPSKPSPVPATRKSWPSTPTSRALGTASAKISTGPPSGTLASRQKSQSPLTTRQKPVSPAPVLRPNPKLEKSDPKAIKNLQVDSKKKLGKVDDSKTHIPSKNGKMTKSKISTAVKAEADISPVKTVVRKKGTKKSSVVPLETKPPTTRKVSGSTPVSSPLKKTEVLVHTEETSSVCENPVENINPDTIHPLDSVIESEPQNNNLGLDMESERENINNRKDDEPAEQVLDSFGKIESEEETIISPAAWEESNQENPAILIGDGESSPTPVNDEVAASSGTRVRHSLSQMLLEESGEPDIIEWGNAENPPSMIYQKDAPKGFKRLLKVALHSKNNHGEGFTSDLEPLSARSNASNASVRSSSKFQDGHSSKGTRSFFSLSAFRGNKS